MKILLIFCFFTCNLFASWVMFSDGEDTYIYNDTTGDVYIRHKKGGKNYEDIFIKMPSGVIPKNLNSNVDKKSFNGYNYEDISSQAIKQRELLDELKNLQNNTLDKILE